MSDLVAALLTLVAVLEELRVSFQIGGSVASSLHGVPRTTLDVDVIAALAEGHADRLAERLAGEYYLDRDTLRAAIAGRTCCNLIHLPTMLKVDLFTPKDRPFDRESCRRIHWDTLGEEEGSPRLPFATAEDMILHKLEWYELGGQVSERQWGDVVGMLKVQGEALDLAYLSRWADALGLGGLLAKVSAAAAGPSGPPA